MNNRQFRVFGFYMILFLLFVVMLRSFQERSEMENLYTYNEFREDVKKGEVVRAVVSQDKATPTGTVTLTMKSGGTRKIHVPDTVEAREVMEAAGVSVSFMQVKDTDWMTSLGVPLLITVVVVFFMVMMMNRQSGGGNGRMMDFGKSRARMTTQEQIHTSFKNVAGLQEEKEELREIVDFLKTPQKFVRVGARIPKGVLLEGPPGTGKTLLAKAVAGEAGVPFFSISGSDFVEMFVGVGASRVRDLFADAKRNHPCIVFIDEIDAVARRRGSGMGGGHDEREQTLNQLLVEMDGFGVNEGIIVMAATNRVDILDPAILRPGRFDRKIMVGRPDVKGREEILKVHANGKPLAEDVDLKQVAQTTAGMTGADLENLMNEAAINAVKHGRRAVSLICHDISSVIILHLVVTVGMRVTGKHLHTGSPAETS